MLLAGLWDCVTLEGASTVLSSNASRNNGDCYLKQQTGSSEPLWTFTIVTTDASKDLSWLHDRQPVILPDEHALSVWLDTSSGKWTLDLSKLCAPYSCAEHTLMW